MCNPASFIIGPGYKVYWSKVSDSHEDIINEYHLSHLDASIDHVGIVRVELVPDGNDFRLPIAQWKFNTDQDIIPGWYDAEIAENETRKELAFWLKSKVVLPEQEIDISEHFLLAVYGTVNEVCDGGTVNRVYGGTVNRVSGGGKVNEVYGGTVNRVYGGTVNRVYGGGTVNRVYDGGKVNEVYGGTVITYTKLDYGILKGETSVLVDRSGKIPVCLVGIQKKD